MLEGGRWCRIHADPSLPEAPLGFYPGKYGGRYGGRNSTTAEEVSKFQCLFPNPNWLV